MNKYQKIKNGFTLISTACKRSFINNKGFTLIRKPCEGFTLIELLIVIVIIGILTGISVFALAGSRESARDVRRKVDLEQIRSALQIYRSDCNRYPSSISFGLSNNIVGGGTDCTAAPSTNIYLEGVPQDPSNGRTYAYKTSGTPPSSYTLCAALEDVTTVDSRCSGLSCGTGTCSYSVTSF